MATASTVKQASTESPTFTISRTFDAPLARVWSAWTNQQEFPKWFGPKGFTCCIETFTLDIGGVCHSYLRSPEGYEMWGKFIYREIIPQKKLVWEHSFADKDGHRVRHPMNAEWPLVLLTTVNFSELNSQTTIELSWTPYNASSNESRVFTSGMDSMNQGWTGTFDQLEAYLNTK